MAIAISDEAALVKPRRAQVPEVSFNVAHSSGVLGYPEPASGSTVVNTLPVPLRRDS